MLSRVRRTSVIAAGVVALVLAGAPIGVAAQPAGAPAVSITGKSDAEKAAEKAAKEAAKAAKDAEKAAEKAAKDVQAAADQAAKEAAKAAKDAEKAVEKAANDAAKDAAKQLASSVAAAARAEAAAEAVRLVAAYTDTEIKDEIRDAQRDARSTFKSLTKGAQASLASNKKQARSDYKAALEAADAAATKAERKELRKAAQDAYAAAKKENRTAYLNALKDARRYNGKAQIVFFSPTVTELGEYDAPIPVAAVATSGLAVEISSLTEETCTVTDGLVTPVQPGDCTMVASQDGNATYAPASTEATIVILDQPDPQAIEFAALPALEVGGGVQPLQATATSGLPVTFATKTPTVCSVAGSTVTALAEGACTVEATQAGDEAWEAAESVVLTGQVTVPPVASEGE